MSETKTTVFRDLLAATKDGDWGKGESRQGHVPAYVIRGTDFAEVRRGCIAGVPIRYLAEKTVHRRLLRADDILIETAGGSRDRPTGRTVLISQEILDAFPGDVTCASFARFLRVDPVAASPRYVYWYLQYLYARGDMWTHQVQHTGVARFQFTRFAGTEEVPLPVRAEQDAIAAVLGALDDKIAVNERIATTADSMCDLIFQSRAQQHASVPMSRLLHPILGGTPDRKNESYWGGSVPWASAKDVVNATVGVLASTEEHITETATQNSRAKTLRPGSVVLTARGTVGAVARMVMPAAINQSCYAFEPGRMPAAVLFHMVRSAAKSMLGMAHGTVFSTVNMKTFDHVEIPNLPADVLNTLNGELASLHQLIVSHLQESRQLATLRDTLLPQLMSGRLRVKDAEKIAEEAT